MSRNDEQAIYWYRKAAEQGQIVAQGIVGTYYQKGRGVRKNYFMAAKWWKKAADGGDTEARKNLEKALPWFVEAADFGKNISVSQFCKNGERIINKELRKDYHPFKEYVQEAHMTVRVYEIYVSDITVKTKDGGGNIGEDCENVRSIKIAVTARWNGIVHKGGRTVLTVLCENIDGNIKLTDAKITYTDAAIDITDPAFWINAGSLLMEIEK